MRTPSKLFHTQLNTKICRVPRVRNLSLVPKLIESVDGSALEQVTNFVQAVHAEYNDVITLDCFFSSFFDHENNKFQTKQKTKEKQ